MSTREVLEFQSTHAAARDAVHTPLAVDDLLGGLEGLRLGTPTQVTSRATSRAEYLRRPDLGRLPADLSSLEHAGADVGIVVADGLSDTAVDAHAVGRPGLSVADSLGIYLTYHPRPGRRDSGRSCISNTSSESRPLEATG